ncbi:hypothetical protein HCN52_20580, partial [Streptomyces bohaiensis]|nr:hypothetical protein [Streptomyces bohaiensis]
RGTGTARFLAGAARANAVTGADPLRVEPRPAAAAGPPPFQRVAALPQVAPDRAPVIRR